MFRRILIANRGEIACRVIRTAKRLGIATVAVHSDADAGALHVALADAAFRIGPAPARDSYLRGEAIIAAAQAAGAEAIHPGYGFLSENADFAEACAAANLVFIGPPPAAIRAMGSKAAAKALMQRAGVPLVPGYHDADQDDATLTTAAVRIGYPVLIKASAGGGGKGMRVVEDPGDFAAALAGARREAQSSFADDRVLIERYLTRPRHIEVQVFADTHGETISLFERDCSIQRRHQKVLEEAPAPGLTPAMRRDLGEAAIAAARAVDYVGAGTVEFIAEADRFYFMEMNTRLQVEHPVTEAITGLDLVEWQLRVAAGEPLPRRAADLRIDGHAIEARLYAEDPTRNFLPATGTLAHLRQPAADAHVRLDTGVREGDAITPFYDPMIAKLIVWDVDRDAAVARLAAALADYEIVGPRTNLDLLRAIVAAPAFRAAELDTGFIARHPEVQAPAAPLDLDIALAACLLHTLRAEPEGDDPWSARDGWRLAGRAARALVFEDGETHQPIAATPRPDGGYTVALPGGEAVLHRDGEALRLGDRRVPAKVVAQGDALVVFSAGRSRRLRLRNPYAPPEGASAAGGKVMAPIPGTVTRLLVAAGDAVTRGQALLVLEAMKMELTLSAPADGRVAALRCAAGEMVQEGIELVVLESA